MGIAPRWPPQVSKGVVRRASLSLGCLCAVTLALGGPPFVTDDPEPVEYQHSEIYLASIVQREPGDTNGTLPHLEFNYGVIPDVQLHIIAPAAFDARSGNARQFGYGDTELGVKYRFIDEADDRPQVAIFPLVELPTGASARGLGAGHTQLFLPVWVQKGLGSWTTYGGGGYWVNPGPGNRNWWFAGWLVQKQVLPSLAVGAEIYHETAKTIGGQPDTKANLGIVWDLNDTCHVLASAGPVVEGPSGYQAYVAFQLTLGPKK